MITVILILDKLTSRSQDNVKEQLDALLASQRGHYRHQQRQGLPPGTPKKRISRMPFRLKALHRGFHDRSPRKKNLLSNKRINYLAPVCDTTACERHLGGADQSDDIQITGVRRPVI